MNPPDSTRPRYPVPFTIREPMGKLAGIVGIHPDTLKWMFDTGQEFDPNTAYIETRLSADDYKACIEREPTCDKP